MSMTPEKLTEELRAIYGDNLTAVLLYGSAASGDYTKKFSDFNTLVVLRQISLDDLRQGSKIVRKWVKGGNPPPLMFTLDRLKRSADVFPMEISDIKEFHRVLYGENPLADVEVSVDNLRLELERELKGKLIQLRERYFMCAGDKKAVSDLLARSSSTFLTLFRHTLRLVGVTPLPAKRDAAKVLARHIAYDATIFDHIRTLRDTGKLPADLKADDLFEKYLPFVEHVVDAVDAWVHGQPFPEAPAEDKGEMAAPGSV